MKQIIWFSIALFILISCKSETTKPQSITILFTNGKLFCQGNHIYSQNKKDTVRIGPWNFYYPDGQLEIFAEYDEDGEILSYNHYSVNGVLILSYSKKDELQMYSKFYESGNIKSETVIQSTNVDEDKTEKKSFTKEYYPNGKIMRESQQIDGLNEGVVKIWDMDEKLGSICKLS